MLLTIDDDRRRELLRERKPRRENKWSSSLRAKLRIAESPPPDASAAAYKRNRLESRREIRASALRHARAAEEFRSARRELRKDRPIWFSLAPPKDDDDDDDYSRSALSSRKKNEHSYLDATSDEQMGGSQSQQQQHKERPQTTAPRSYTTAMRQSSTSSSSDSIAADGAVAEARKRARFFDRGDDAFASRSLDPTHYFGREARDAFFDLVKHLGRCQSAYVPPPRGTETTASTRWAWDDESKKATAEEEEEEEEEEEVIGVDDATFEEQPPKKNVSPREMFARGLVQKMQGLRERCGGGDDEPLCLPEPVFVRLVECDSLEIAHRGYGDGLAILLARIINELPNLKRLSMRDDRLTDIGISAILGAVCGANQRLVSLDLSQNVLDSVAVLAIAKFLRRPDCKLASLYLDSADIDDNEISLLVSAIEENTSLRDLSISSNFLGGFSEKVVEPQNSRAHSGSFTIERVLKTNRTLRKLDLSWNQLGAISGEAIARALRINRSLAWLSLAYNCVGERGAQAIGYAINWNKALQFLDVSQNGIRNRGGQVLAEGLRENLRLTHVDVSGNPLGALGGRALIGSLNFSLRPRKIVMRGCEATGDDHDQPGRYNPASPSGTYHLDLSTPHDWMVAQSLLWLTVTRAGCRFVRLVEHKDGESREVKLVRARNEDETALGYRPPQKNQQLANPLSSSTSEKFRTRVRAALLAESYESLIARYDRDNSGGLVAAEFRDFIRKTLKMTPIEVSESEAQQLLKRLDKNKSGTVDATELRAFVEEGDDDQPKTLRLGARRASRGSIGTRPRRNSLQVLVAASIAPPPPEKKTAVNDAAYNAACRLQARFRGLMTRIDIAQTKQMFEGGFKSSSVASVLMDREHEGEEEEEEEEEEENEGGNNHAGGVSVFGGTAAKRTAKRLSKSKKKKKKQRPATIAPSQLGKARFRRFSKFAVASSREMRAHMRASGPLDAETGKPWRLPPPPARITATFEQIPLPPIELGIQNATGISGLLALMLDDYADRIALLRLASTDLRLFSIQVQHFLDQVQGSTQPFNSNELVEVFVLLLPRIVDVNSIANLLQRNLSEHQMQQLSFRLGPALAIFSGAVVARHVLDLQQAPHRAALCKLVQLDAIYAAQQRAAFGDDGGGANHDQHIGVYRGGDQAAIYRGGTSQNGDFSGFRNSRLNGASVSTHFLEELASSFGDAGLDANPDLLQGRALLHLDYAGVLRAPHNATVVSEIKLGMLLHKCGLSYTASHIHANPRLARLLPDVLYNTWASRLYAKRQDKLLAAFRRREASDLAGKLKLAKVRDKRSFIAWLEARGVPCKLWDNETQNLAYDEFSSQESHVECELESDKRKHKQARILVVRTVHVVRVRISNALLDKVLTWRLSSSSDKMCNKLEHVVEDALDAAATRDESARSEVLRREASAQCLQNNLRGLWRRAARRIETGEDFKVRAFVTERLRFDDDGHVVVSPARAATRAVVAQLRAHLEIPQLDENMVRILFRTRQEVEHTPTKPRTLLGTRTRAFVYYYEAYVPGLPDQMPPPVPGAWHYRWTVSDEVEDVPVQTEALPKIITNFRIRTSACFFTACQVRKIVDSFKHLAKHQGVESADYDEEVECLASTCAAANSEDSRNRRGSIFEDSRNRRGSVFEDSRSRRGSLIEDNRGRRGSVTEDSRSRRGSKSTLFGDEQLRRTSSHSVNATDGSLEAGARNTQRSSAPPSLGIATEQTVTPFDTHLLDLLVHLFGRVVDVENFYWTCVARMPLHLRLAFIDRIGWLNVLNIEHPELRYELDLRHVDHWKLAHILTQLAANEDGINFRETSFCRTNADPPIPGWTLPASWDVVSYAGNLSKGVPRCGLLKVTYKADPGDTAPFRRRLGMQFTLMGVPRPETDPLDSACRVANAATRLSS
ncbi:hypothetical protein CTAYLR_004221 [Chrysophaeum taylorii]|uniref:EF-hand domain-containing protein n=1 Tax=Chrysophaeum taylorii TaxID=2483200 RepID=A0AAD7UE65_9STRA|nr:hypothetical protein CTAYLR_004221 [Chrysophaeum taylorii]